MILVTQRSGPWPNAPSLNTPLVIGSAKRGTANGKGRALVGVLFARDGIEKPQDSMRIKTAGQIRTEGLPGCRFCSKND